MGGIRLCFRNGFYNSALKPYYEEADRGYKRWTESEVCVDDYWSIAFQKFEEMCMQRISSI